MTTPSNTEHNTPLDTQPSAVELMGSAENARELAYAFAAAGVPVIRVGTDKPEDAATNPEAVEEWTGGGDPAIACGQGVAVMKVSDQEALTALKHGRGDLPHTLEFYEHRDDGTETYYVYRTGDRQVFSGEDEFGEVSAPGIAVFAGGEFVPLPRSSHPLDPLHVIPRDVALIPEWLAALTRADGRTLTVADLIEGGEGPAYTVDGVVQSNGRTTLFGPTDTFKTFTALDMALHVAAGRDWHGRSVRRGPVVYIAAEAAEGYGARVRAWTEAHPGAKLGHEDFRLVDAPLNLLRDADVRRFLDRQDRHGPSPELVVIDPLFECMPGANEATSGDMGQALRSINRIRRHWRCGVLIVHHTGVSERRRERGHSSLMGAMDERWRAAKQPGTAPRVELRHVRSRHRARQSAPLEFALSPVAGSLVLKSTESAGDIDWWAAHIRQVVTAYHEDHGEWPTRSSTYRDLMKGRTTDNKAWLSDVAGTDASGVTIRQRENGKGEEVVAE